MGHWGAEQRPNCGACTATSTSFMCCSDFMSVTLSPICIPGPLTTLHSRVGWMIPKLEGDSSCIIFHFGPDDLWLFVEA